MSFFKNLSTVFTSSGIETPSFCELNTAEEQNTKGYEEREYGSTAWVSTTVKAMTHRKAVSTGFWRLFNYIQGENASKEKIEMTAPVATKVVPGAGPNCESSFTISFYIGKQHEADPPAPNHKEVFIDRWPAMRVFVRRFGGFADDDKWVAEAEHLSKCVNKNQPHIKDYFYTCGYDAPFKLFNRRNEVWFVKEIVSDRKG